MKKILANLKTFLLKILKGNKPSVLCMKYIPVLGTALAALHVAMLLCGFSEPVTMSITVLLLLVLLVVLSFRFGFCKLHKAMILYMCVMVMCVLFQKFNLFGWLLTAFRVIMLTLGIGLVIWACVKDKCDDCVE